MTHFINSLSDFIAVNVRVLSEALVTNKRMLQTIRKPCVQKVERFLPIWNRNRLVIAIDLPVSYVCFMETSDLKTDESESKGTHDFEKDYLELFDSFNVANPLFERQWQTQGDYFVQFSLYPQTESGPATANTSVK